ncbi:C4-dicarboxylate ABC transporter permease [Oceanicola sp. 22II-s10i]|nr:C4-dicarboxylate ABC transporter permease [Oceanicola sp. 22II-s10i]
MHDLFRWLARAMAILGGVVLTALILLTCVSILGRSGNTILHFDWLEQLAPALTARLLEAGIAPVPGDIEVTEAGMAFVIFAFLPICQITGAHAVVDIFTSQLGVRANRALAFLWEALFAVALVVIAWKLQEGMAGKMRYGETTFILQFPVWWSYAASLAGACVAAVVGIYVAVMRGVELMTGRAVLADGGSGA